MTRAQRDPSASFSVVLAGRVAMVEGYGTG